MALRVVGAGFGRTGTNSLKVALEKLLGAPCYHMIEVFTHPEHVPAWHDAALNKPVDWDRLFEGYAAAVDWPASAYWPELMKKYPDALVLLSVRDPESWWKSATDTIFKGINNTSRGLPPEWMAMIRAMFARYWSGDTFDHDAVTAALMENTARAKREVPPDRLLVWQASDGWEPICKRLGVPVPNEPFPRTNTSEEWRAREAAAAAGQTPAGPAH
jgi:sulfotransferase family protein